MGWYRNFPLLVLLLVALRAPNPLGGATPAVQPPVPRSLDIYWIDVEGGAATLIVTPQGETILMDAGWDRPDGRDADRIVAAMRDAGVDQLDYFIASHFHGDHVGGLPALATRVPIGEFIDHGDSVEQDRPGARAAFQAYVDLTAGRRRTVTPGERLRVRGIDFSFVTAHGAVRDRSSSMGPNFLCDRADPGDDDVGENSRSVGYLLSLGGFQFLNLGDLTPNVQHRLACPEALLGAVDVFQVPHHGNGVSPQLTWALAPAVAVVANGPHKGGSAAGHDVVSQTPGLEHLWQLHQALDNDPSHNTENRFIANLSGEEECEGHWIKASINPDGRGYTLRNGRTGMSEAYASR